MSLILLFRITVIKYNSYYFQISSAVKTHNKQGELKKCPPSLTCKWVLYGILKSLSFCFVFFPSWWNHYWKSQLKRVIMKGEHFFLTHPVVVVVLAVESLRVMSRIQNRKEKTNSFQVIMYEKSGGEGLLIRQIHSYRLLFRRFCPLGRKRVLE